MSSWSELIPRVHKTFVDARIIEVTQTHLIPHIPSPVNDEDPVEELVLGEVIVEEVPPVEPHITVSAAAATPVAPAAGFDSVQESKLEATAEADTVRRAGAGRAHPGLGRGDWQRACSPGLLPLLSTFTELTNCQCIVLTASAICNGG